MKTTKKCVSTISLILLLLNTFTACSKDGDTLDKEFANTVWIHRFTPRRLGLVVNIKIVKHQM